MYVENCQRFWHVVRQSQKWRINVQNLVVKQLACSSWCHLSLEHFEVIWDDSNTQEKLKTKAIHFFLCRVGRGGQRCFMGNAQVVNTMLKPRSNCALYGLSRGSWYVQCNISQPIDSLESPTPFDAAKQATLQCVKRKSLIRSLSLCHYSMVLSKKHCMT